MGSDVLGPSSWPEVEPWTPAHQAVEMSEYETLSMLLDAGADPDEVCFGHTLLTHAIDSEGDGHLQSGHPLHTASTAIVLAYGAGPHWPAASGKTPLQMAESYDHEPAKRLLQRFLAPAEAPGSARVSCPHAAGSTGTPAPPVVSGASATSSGSWWRNLISRGKRKRDEFCDQPPGTSGDPENEYSGMGQILCKIFCARAGGPGHAGVRHRVR
ncbi:hypothetical protein ACFCXK_33905 [Streptomyces sp. NPDC056269]|uniref:hypothetical protein n=1 Tax=Streptomyces sp. NPDC056269 TaxID=3345768 RepID=UPI0035D9FB44